MMPRHLVQAAGVRMPTPVHPRLSTAEAYPFNTSTIVLPNAAGLSAT